MKTMLKSKVILFVIFSALSLAGCSNSKGPASDNPTSLSPSPQTQKVTSAGVVNVKPQQPVEIGTGGSGEAVVRLVIQSGYHVNANPPTYPYLIATQLDIKPSEGVTAGKVTYPAPITGTFAFAEKPLAVYEGTTEIKAEIKADKTASKGSRSVPAILRIQACDNQVCYPPGTVSLEIPVTIK